jgi:anti-sigma regulatory factor (Ser/Thr protein kinase)
MEKIINSLLPQQCVVIAHASDIAAARRAGQRMAHTLGFDDIRNGQLAIMITEAATNILKHAGEGRLFLSEAHAGERCGIDLLALDNGPGISNLGQALRDGVSSTGTAGTGLGALRRLSDEFDVYAPRGKGAAFFMRLWCGAAPLSALQFGAVCLPLAGEQESGDAWAVAPHRLGATLMAVDGLGHGVEAAAAARAAVQTLVLHPELLPAEQVESCHHALRATRGAALAVAQIDSSRRQLHFAGIGNISVCLIVDGEPRRQMMSHNGIVGHNMRKVQEFIYPCPAGALIVMHSDGINNQWDLDNYPGLMGCSTAIIAGILLRDFSRGRDDACVLVKRYQEMRQ